MGWQRVGHNQKTNTFTFTKSRLSLLWPLLPLSHLLCLWCGCCVSRYCSSQWEMCLGQRRKWLSLSWQERSTASLPLMVTAICGGRAVTQHDQADPAACWQQDGSRAEGTSLWSGHECSSSLGCPGLEWEDCVNVHTHIYIFTYLHMYIFTIILNIIVLEKFSQRQIYRNKEMSMKQSFPWNIALWGK